MAVYVTSDLHGYPFDEFMNLLDKVNFGENDYLFILGDVIDRGPDGLKYLDWLLTQYNVQLLLGNHEATLLACQFIFDDQADISPDVLKERMGIVTTWQHNGGASTMLALKELSQRDPDALTDIIDYLSDLPLFETVSVGDRDFLLTHSGLENFSPDRKFTSYSADELIWHRPTIVERYFDDITTVFGHTPTMVYGEEHRGKILKTETWINIDTGAGHGEKPALLRLDDLAEIYMD